MQLQYGHSAVIRHEPCADGYMANYHFQAYHDRQNIVLNQALVAHLAFVKQKLKSKDYIETGWPGYGAMPFVIRELGDENVRVVHLYRDPCSCTRSLDSHQIYNNREILVPRLLFNDTLGVIQHNIRDTAWSSKSHIGKCLFFWTELNAYALRLRRQIDKACWYDLKYEKLFDGHQGPETLGGLLDFMHLPNSTAMLEALRQTVDNYIRPKKPDFDQCFLTEPKTTAFLNTVTKLRYPTYR